LGVATWGVLLLLGMPNAALWGTLAALLNFVPYLGAFVTLGVSAVAAIAVFDIISQASSPTGTLTVVRRSTRACA